MVQRYVHLRHYVNCMYTDEFTKIPNPQLGLVCNQQAEDVLYEVRKMVLKHRRLRVVIIGARNQWRIRNIGTH